MKGFKGALYFFLLFSANYRYTSLCLILRFKQYILPVPHVGDNIDESLLKALQIIKPSLHEVH